MIIETDFEIKKNSKGERATVRHFLMDSDSDAAALPADAPVGSDALSDTSVFVKFPSGWRSV